MDDWISVKERLPEELTEVIVFTEATEQGVCMAFLENGKWLDGYSGRGIVMMQQELVTHWMPLPQPPKEDTHDDQDKPLRRCDRRCIANVGGQCAVADCRGSVGQIPMGPNRTLESSARYYQYVRSAFDDYLGEGGMDDGTEE